MDNLFDYLKWMGDFPIEATGLLEADAMVFGVLSYIDMDPVFDYYTPVIAVNDDFAAANPELVRGFLRAARRGYEFAIDDPAAAADILCAAVPELDPELIHVAQEFISQEYVADAASWGEIDPERWPVFYQWLNDEGLVENPIDVNAGYTLDFLEA